MTPTQSIPTNLRFVGTRRGRLTLFFLLYLAEGLPLGLSIYALTAYFRMADVPVGDIGAFMAAIIAPWSMKWLWAPLVDLIRPRWIGPNRAWILFTQGMMAATLAFLFVLDPSQDLGLLTALMVVHNVFAATQDVAIDGFAGRVLPVEELTWANGLMFAAQNLGMAIGGGGSMYLAGVFGFRAAFVLVLGSLLCIMLGVSMRIQEPAEEAAVVERPGSWLATFGLRLEGFFTDLWTGVWRSGNGPRLGILFAVLPSGAMALAYGISSALLVDLGFSSEQLSVATTVALLAAGAGCVVSGPLGDKFGAKRVLAAGHVVGAIPTAILGYLIWTNGLEGVSFGAYLGLAVLYRIGFGLIFGPMGAVFMSMTNPSVAATQFTGYMSLRNVAIAYSGAWQGQTVGRMGYAPTLFIDALVGLLPILMIPFLRPSTVRADQLKG